MQGTFGEFPACYLACALAAKRGGAAGKLLGKKNRGVFKLKMSEETEEIRRRQLGALSRDNLAALIRQPECSFA